MFWLKRKRIRIAFAFSVILSGGFIAHTEAGDLSDVLERGFSFPAEGGINIETGARAISPAIAAAVSQAVTQQFPLASISPAFTYRLNIDLGLPEPVSSIPGPLFAERALTIGKGRLNVNVGYAYIDFDEYNGTSLNRSGSSSFFLTAITNEAIPIGSSNGNTVFEAPSFLSQSRSEIDLQAHVIVPSLRYGLTDNWDVGLSIPIVNTSLRVRSSLTTGVEPFGSVFRFEQDAQGNIPTFGFFATDTGAPVATADLRFIKARRALSNNRKSSGSATGIGDITLRTKYRLPFLQTDKGGAAIGLNLLLPSGDEDDFHGTGDVRVSPFLFVSNVIGERFEPHLNLGFEINADDIDRSSFLYSVGMVVQIWQGLGLMIDIIGRTELSSPERFPSAALVPQVTLDRNPETCTEANPCRVAGTVLDPLFLENPKRNDTIDFAFGLRYALGQQGSIFFGGLIPITDDGFRSDFIPAGGIEYTF